MFTARNLLIRHRTRFGVFYEQKRPVSSEQKEKTPWVLSKIGMGTRRFVSGDSYALQEALKTRLSNVIDVGAGWNSGIAARTVGEALLSVFDDDGHRPAIKRS